jgi:hypothetical protein
MLLNRDVVDGLKHGVLFGAAVLVLVLPHVGRHTPAPGSDAPSSFVQSSMQSGTPMAPAAAAPTAAAEAAGGLLQRRLDFGLERPSRDARRLAQWVVDSADNGDRPFVILDKRNAKVYVFEASGSLAGASPVLLGYAAGDDTVPGIGERPIEQVKPSERTTPAGRFVAERGRNARHEDVVWVDYDAAVSMHRVITSNPAERRLERLASPTSSDNRISYGCINLPPQFFEGVLFPHFQQGKGVVYVLPEIKRLQDVFPGLNTPYQLARTRALTGPPAL